MLVAVVVAAFVAVATAAGPAEGQACVGMPAPGGGAFVGGMVQPADALGAEVASDGWLGAEVGARVGGPVTLRGRYRWRPEDGLTTGAGSSPPGDDHSVEALATAPIDADRWDLCPAVGGELRLQLRSGRESREEWRVPAGVGVGRTFDVGERARLTAYAFPQAVLVSSPVSRTNPAEGAGTLDDRESEMEARLDFGTVLAVGDLYGGLAFRVGSDLEGTVGFDRALELWGGVVF